MYDVPKEWLSLIPLYPAPLALLPNPIVVPTFPIQPIHQTPLPFLEPLPHTLSPSSGHIEHDFLTDPFDQLISSIPSHSKMSSSPCHFIHTVKRKPPSITITLQTW
jgi:hypothetical protein